MRVIYNGSSAMRPCPYGIQAGAAKRRFTVFTPEWPPPSPPLSRTAAPPQFGFACTCINAGKCPLGTPAPHRSRSLRVFGYAKHIQRHPGCRETSIPKIDQEIVRSRNCWGGRWDFPTPTPIQNIPSPNAHARTHPLLPLPRPHHPKSRESSHARHSTPQLKNLRPAEKDPAVKKKKD